MASYYCSDRLLSTLACESENGNMRHTPEQVGRIKTARMEYEKETIHFDYSFHYPD
jgi:hypothetical protein